MDGAADWRLRPTPAIHGRATSGGFILGADMLGRRDKRGNGGVARTLR